MPELPEVEILSRHLDQQIRGWTILSAQVLRPRVIRPESSEHLIARILQWQIIKVARRGKYLVLELTQSQGKQDLIVHLGMTGRLFTGDFVPHPHTAMLWKCDQGSLIFRDARTLGRVSLDTTCLDRLGQDPLRDGQPEATYLRKVMGRSRASIKSLLMDQSRLAGLGNIYACEILHRAGVHPARRGDSLLNHEWERLSKAIDETLSQALQHGSSCELDWEGGLDRSKFFYFGSAGARRSVSEERFGVYDREKAPCRKCGQAVERIVQAGRSSYFCPNCQSLRRSILA